MRSSSADLSCRRLTTECCNQNRQRGRRLTKRVEGLLQEKLKQFGDARVVIQIVRFESELSEEAVLAVAQSRIEEFRALPGLIQKYYVKLAEPNRYGGCTSGIPWNLCLRIASRIWLPVFRGHTK